MFTHFQRSLFGLLLIGSALFAEPVDIGDRLELFVDSLLVEELQGSAHLRLHRPTPEEVVLTTDEPWEGNVSGYFTVFQDGDLYRMYYRGLHYDAAADERAHRELTCYAESTDGVVWTKPALGLFEFNGSKQNNIVLDGLGTHCFTPFKDENPTCPPEARYKAVSRGSHERQGLYLFQSADGIRWSLISDDPVITDGRFDSQNLAFWDAPNGQYVTFFRDFRNGLRDIKTATSKDFLRWTKPKYLEYTGASREHLYTNAIRNYPRAPHIKLGFPTRLLPDQGNRTEPTLMASRDGERFFRWSDALIPEDAPEDRAGNRSNYAAWGLMKLPGKDRELSVYATEGYYAGPDSRLRRFSFRVDGFVSASAHGEPGAVLTKPVTFAGSHLQLNYVAGNDGNVQVELLDKSGEAFDGYSASNCAPLQGDAIAGEVQWKDGRNAESLIGETVQISFILQNADLYSFRFAK